MLAAFDTHTNVPAELNEILGPNHFFEHNVIGLARDIRRSINQGFIRQTTLQQSFNAGALTSYYTKQYKTCLEKMAISADDVPYEWEYIYEMMKLNHVYFILKTHKFEKIEAYMTFEDRFQKICRCSVNRMDRTTWDNIPLPDFISLYTTVSFVRPTDDQLFYLVMTRKPHGERRGARLTEDEDSGEPHMPKLTTSALANYWLPLIDFENEHAKKNTIYWTRVHQQFEERNARPTNPHSFDVIDLEEPDSDPGMWTQVLTELQGEGGDPAAYSIMRMSASDDYDDGIDLHRHFTHAARDANDIINSYDDPDDNRINNLKDLITTIGHMNRPVIKYIIDNIGVTDKDKKVLRQVLLLEWKPPGFSEFDDVGTHADGRKKRMYAEENVSKTLPMEWSSAVFWTYCLRTLNVSEDVWVTYLNSPEDAPSLLNIPQLTGQTSKQRYINRCTSLEEIWRRSQSDIPALTVKRVDEDNANFVVLAESVTEYFHGTTPYQVASAVAGFSGQQVSQLYYESNISDAISEFEEIKTGSKRIKFSKSSFADAIQQFEPGELLSGVVREALLHEALLKLHSSPKWTRKINWRPSLISHYKDVMDMIHHRLVVDKGDPELINATKRERDRANAQEYGRELFKRENEIMILTERVRIAQRKVGRADDAVDLIDFDSSSSSSSSSSPSPRGRPRTRRRRVPSRSSSPSRSLSAPQGWRRWRSRSAPRGWRRVRSRSSSPSAPRSPPSRSSSRGRPATLRRTRRLSFGSIRPSDKFPKTPARRGLAGIIQPSAQKSAKKQYDIITQKQQDAASIELDKARALYERERNKERELKYRLQRRDHSPRLYEYRLDICHIIALRMRNDQMLRPNFSGISRTFPRSKRMIQARMTLLLSKMTSHSAN